MNAVKPERATQNRVVKLFTEELGYTYLGDWQKRENNSNIEEKLLTDYLTGAGYTPAQISKAILKLKEEANRANTSLYDKNKAVYSLLYYGTGAKTEVGKNTDQVHFINWAEPEKNHFCIAEEVTLKGGENTRRPDLVLYINGLAIAVIELKKSTVSIGEGIRQLISNQKKEFNEWFFSTVQMAIAGSDSEGLKYGTINTEEKYYLTWKEDIEDNSRNKLDKYLLKLCNKKRLLEILYDFVLFDGGIKKLPRFHQYFGIKAAQDHVKRKEGGIIWHTQGSGKSIVMVLLAKWILENNPHARVAIVTDRTELDNQIVGVFNDAGETIHKSTSGRDLIHQLSQTKPRLISSLVHKFGKKQVNDFDEFIRDLEAQPSPAVGEIFIFVDECHRTQSGKLHRTMKAILPQATFIGFTGTPLLKADEKNSREVFGNYIHTYKFNEAVEDGIVLDLVYEARDIDQNLGSETKIDAWFDAKTKGLNDWQKAKLRQKWGTMQKVLSSRSRMDRVVSDIIFDFSVKPRLSDDRGTAILVASSIYEACKYYDLFQKTAFKNKSAIITSYNPQARDISTEDTGTDSATDKEFIYNTYTELLKNVGAQGNKTKTEIYEEQAKKDFKEKPGQMKLLIVVNKLLTGFDAPSCTYIYLDKNLQDHGLFQAICRTNRLDGEDKNFGYIVDYKDLFRQVKDAIGVYTSELAQDNQTIDPQILLKDRLSIAKEQLEDAFEAVFLICEPVAPPRESQDYIDYFCGNTEIPTDIEERAFLRNGLYQAIAVLIRAFAQIANDLDTVGYSRTEAQNIKQKVNDYKNIREVVRHASGEYLELKPYEADMRHLIDTYIEADEPRKISEFDKLPLIDLIVKTSIHEAVDHLPTGIRENKKSVAETIENNVRRVIVQEQINDPAYYREMSKLLDELIAERKREAIAYEELLQKYAELAQKIKQGKADDTPAELDSSGKLALYNNLKIPSSQTPNIAKEKPTTYQTGKDFALELALKIDATVKQVRPDGWRGERPRENIIKQALFDILQDGSEVERIFIIIENQSEY